MKRLACLLLAALPALGADRSQPPRPGPARPLTLPAVQKLALSNGLPVLLAESHEVPVAELMLVVRSGSAADLADRPGLAAMAADMLDEGAGGKDALALADAVDLLGAGLGAGSSWDSSYVSLRVPVARLEAGLGLMADAALRPDFPARELERLRKETLTELLQARDRPGSLAGRALALAVFGDTHPYGRHPAGDARSVSAMNVSDLQAFHARHYRPENAALVVVGDVTPAVLPLLERAFGAWAKAGASSPAGVSEPPQVKGRSVWLVDRPGAAQSVIRIGRVGPRNPAPDQATLLVMNTLLGGSFTSRLNDNLREQHGYAYGARSGFDQRRVAGLFQAAADVQTHSTAEALGEFMKELRRIREPATAEEVERARNYLALSYVKEFETAGDLAGKLAEQWLYGLPDDYFSAFVPKALATGVAVVEGAAARIDTANLAIVVVGDRAKVEAKLRALNLGPLKLLSIDDVMGPAPQL